MIPNEDPLGLALDYGEMEEGEIDEVVEAEPMPDDESDSKGIFDSLIYNDVIFMYG